MYTEHGRPLRNKTNPHALTIGKEAREGSVSSFTTARGGKERRGVGPDALVAAGGYGGRRRGGRGARLHRVTRDLKPPPTNRSR
jgi:hypothetical protein